MGHSSHDQRDRRPGQHTHQPQTTRSFTDLHLVQRTFGGALELVKPLNPYTLLGVSVLQTHLI